MEKFKLMVISLLIISGPLNYIIYGIGHTVYGIKPPAKVPNIEIPAGLVPQCNITNETKAPITAFAVHSIKE